MTDIGWAVASGALHLLVVGVIFGPLVWWRARRRRERAIGPGGWRTLALAGGIYLTAIIVLNLPRVGFFADLTFNWQNKLLLVLLLAVAVRGWPGLTWRGVGVRRPARRWWVPVLAIVLGALGLQLLGGPMAEVTPTVEAAAFQAVVPGLDEELLFRGVLLFLLDRALTARRAMWGGQVGWSALVTSVLFGLGHGLELGEGFEIAVHPVGIVPALLLGLLIAWLRVRWRSLWPAVLAHNGWNLSVVVAGAVAE